MLLDDKDAKPADSSPADDEPKQDADDESLDSEGDDEKEPDGPLHKSDRWKEVYGKYKEYKALGDPADLQTRLARLEYYDNLVEQYEEKREPDEPKTDEQKAAEKDRAAARKALSEVAPEVDQIKVLAKEMRLYWEGVIDAAEDATVEVMEEAGMPTEAKDIKAMSEVLQSIIKEDRKLHLRFRRDPEGAVKRAFERFSETFAKGDRKRAASTQREKERLTKLPRTVKPGGGPSPEKKGEPKNLAEAAAGAKEFWKQWTG